MPGLISGYSGDVCQHVVYNRSGLRTFSSAVGAHTAASADKWAAAVAPMVVASAYILVVVRRVIASLQRKK
jgi:hypothetical protein